MQGTNRNGLYSIFGPLPVSRATIQLRKLSFIEGSCSSRKRSRRPAAPTRSGMNGRPSRLCLNWNWEEQRMTAKVTVEDVARVAELAHLELAPEETPRMLHDLNAILDYVAELNELDTSGVEPLSQVTELLNADKGELRADVVLPSLDRALSLIHI